MGANPGAGTKQPNTIPTPNITPQTTSSPATPRAGTPRKAPEGPKSQRPHQNRPKRQALQGLNCKPTYRSDSGRTTMLVRRGAMLGRTRSPTVRRGGTSPTFALTVAAGMRARVRARAPPRQGARGTDPCAASGQGAAACRLNYCSLLLYICKTYGLTAKNTPKSAPTTMNDVYCFFCFSSSEFFCISSQAAWPFSAMMYSSMLL